jgi:hypothetical protein
VAARCRSAKRAARRTPGTEGPPKTAAIALEEAHLTDEQWALVGPLLPPAGGRDWQATRRPPHGAGRHPVGGEDRIVVAGDAGGVRQMGESVPAPRAVGRAGLVGANPPFVRRRRSAGTGNEGA